MSKDASIGDGRPKVPWPEVELDELKRREIELARDILNVVRLDRARIAPSDVVPEPETQPPPTDSGDIDADGVEPSANTPIVTRSRARGGVPKAVPAAQADPKPSGSGSEKTKGGPAKSAERGAKSARGGRAAKTTQPSVPADAPSSSGSRAEIGSRPEPARSAQPPQDANPVGDDPRIAGLLVVPPAPDGSGAANLPGGADADSGDTGAICVANEGKTRGGVTIGDRSVHPKMVLSDLVFNTENFDVPRAGSMLATMVRYALQKPECHRWDAAAQLYEVVSPLMHPTFAGLSPPTDVILEMMEKIDAAPNTFLRTTVQTDTDLPVDMIEPAIYGEYLIGTNVNARQLANVLAGKLRFTDSNVPAMLTRFFNVQLTRYSNWALYAKLWYYVLGLPLINQTGGVLAAFGPWNANVHTVNMQAQAIAPEVMHLETWVNAGYICFVENIHFTIEQLPLLYLLSCGCNMLDGDAANNQFPFQTFTWPAFHIVLIWTVNQPPPAPNPARPEMGEVFAFCVDMANDRLEHADLARGYYFASDIIASGHVLYEVNQRNPQDVTCAVTPWHEAFGRLVMPRPHDTNVLVRITCPLTPNQDDPDTLADYQVICSRTVAELAHACITSGAIISSFVTTANYSFQFRGRDLQLVPWNGQMNAHQLPFLTSSPWFTNGSRTIETIPLIYTATLRLMARCCGFRRPVSYLITRTWGCGNPLLPGVFAPWTGGLAEQPDWTYTWGNPLAISRWCVYRPAEWGISAPGPIVTFGPDICTTGPLAYRGWSALEGDKSYEERAVSVMPNSVVVYAAYALNVIHQQLELAIPLNISVRPKGVTPGGVGGFLPVQALGAQPPFDNNLMVFQPCTIMSYDFFDHTVYAPFVPMGAFPNMLDDLQRLITMKDFVATLSGLSIGELVDCQRPVPVFAMPLGMRRRGQAPADKGAKKARIEEDGSNPNPEN